MIAPEKGPPHWYQNVVPMGTLTNGKPRKRRARKHTHVTKLCGPENIGFHYFVWPRQSACLEASGVEHKLVNFSAKVTLKVLHTPLDR